MSAGKKILHEIVQDFKAVTEKLGRAPTRDEYQVHGIYPRRQIVHEFGSWLELVRAAGATPSNKARSGKDPMAKQILKYDWERNLIRKYREELAPFFNKYLNKAKSTKSIIAASDFHDEYADKFCVNVFLDTLSIEKPDAICLDGDLVDWPEISSFNKDPTRVNNMQGAIDWVIELFKEIRKRCPDSEIIWVLGNHELRLFKYLCLNPGMAGLRVLQFNKLFECDKYSVNIVCRQSFLMEKPKKAQNYYIFDDALVAFHGSSCAKHHASTLLAKFGKTGFSGHVHNRQVHSTKDLNGERFWVSLPTMANYILAEEYINDLDHWSNGFGKFYIDKKRVIEVPIVCVDGFATSSGKFWFRE